MLAELGNSISAALAIGLAALGTAIGIGIIGAKAMESIARQPEAKNAIQLSMIIVVAFIEAIALYALVISLILVTK